MIGTISSLAERVQNDLKHKQQVFMDPATIMMIIALTEAVLKAIKACREARAAKAKLEMEKQQIDGQVVELVSFTLGSVKSPTRQELRALKRIVRKEIGLMTYWAEGDKYVNALLNTGQTVTETELKDALEELDGKSKV